MSMSQNYRILFVASVSVLIRSLKALQYSATVETWKYELSETCPFVENRGNVPHEYELYVRPCRVHNNTITRFWTLVNVVGQACQVLRIYLPHGRVDA